MKRNPSGVGVIHHGEVHLADVVILNVNKNVGIDLIRKTKMNKKRRIEMNETSLGKGRTIIEHDICIPNTNKLFKLQPVDRYRKLLIKQKINFTEEISRDYIFIGKLVSVFTFRNDIKSKSGKIKSFNI